MLSMQLHHMERYANCVYQQMADESSRKEPFIQFEDLENAGRRILVYALMIPILLGFVSIWNL
ncbi:MAG: hypothetical protein JEZ06_04155 [Anaerolineaceae bacterium]|nr:hypothetical protein [Anaerolineaceae bacterium]